MGLLSKCLLTKAMKLGHESFVETSLPWEQKSNKECPPDIKDHCP